MITQKKEDLAQNMMINHRDDWKQDIIEIFGRKLTTKIPEHKSKLLLMLSLSYMMTFDMGNVEAYLKMAIKEDKREHPDNYKTLEATRLGIKSSILTMLQKKESHKKLKNYRIS